MAETQTSPAGGSSLKLLIISAVFALIAAGGGYYAASQGMIPLPGTQKEGHIEKAEVVPLGDIAFVEIAPMLVPMGNLLSNQHLRFRAELEVNPAYVHEVEVLLPRIVDVLNGYLRALDRDDLERSAALILLRANMLRRVQTVVGDGRVKDLLIMEFVVN